MSRVLGSVEHVLEIDEPVFHWPNFHRLDETRMVLQPRTCRFHVDFVRAFPRQLEPRWPNIARPLPSRVCEFIDGDWLHPIKESKRSINYELARVGMAHPKPSRRADDP
jgi:hypothetical protein